MRVYLLLGCLLLLAGCAVKQPQLFSIPLPQWNHATASDRQNLIGQYNVNKLSHYSTEPIITMDSTVPPKKQESQLSILGENQKSSPAISAPKTVKTKTLPPTNKTPPEANWLRLNG